MTAELSGMLNKAGAQVVHNLAHMRMYARSVHVKMQFCSQLYVHAAAFVLKGNYLNRYEQHLLSQPLTVKCAQSLGPLC